MKCACIACRKELDNILKDGLQPYNGTAFSTPGHYGSSIFDPMDGSTIEVVVCDDCLRRAAKDQIVAKVSIISIITHRETKTTLWNPEQEEKWEIVEQETP